MNETPAPPNQDVQHLNLLAIFHYIFAGLMALCACFPFVHVGLGLMFLLAPEQFANGGEAPPRFVGLLFLLMGFAFIAAGWTLAVLVAIVARSLQMRRRWMFCVVVAAISCLFMPLGTVLGVFTLLVLMRPNVQRLFGREPGV